jgi:hypothetical protein
VLGSTHNILSISERAECVTLDGTSSTRQLVTLAAPFSLATARSKGDKVEEVKEPPDSSSQGDIPGFGTPL